MPVGHAALLCGVAAMALDAVPNRSQTVAELANVHAHAVAETAVGLVSLAGRCEAVVADHLGSEIRVFEGKAWPESLLAEVF